MQTILIKKMKNSKSANGCLNIKNVIYYKAFWLLGTSYYKIYLFKTQNDQSNVYKKETALQCHCRAA